MRWHEAVSMVRLDVVRTSILPNQIRSGAAVRERLVLLQIPIGGTQGRASFAEFSRKVSAQPSGAICAALHPRGSFAREHLRCLSRVAPTLRLALQSFVFVQSGVH